MIVVFFGNSGGGDWSRPPGRVEREPGGSPLSTTTSANSEFTEYNLEIPRSLSDTFPLRTPTIFTNRYVVYCGCLLLSTKTHERGDTSFLHHPSSGPKSPVVPLAGFYPSQLPRLQAYTGYRKFNRPTVINR